MLKFFLTELRTQQAIARKIEERRKEKS